MKNFIDFRGKQVHFHVSAKGPAFVLLHGFPESGEVWKNFARRLSKSFGIIAALTGVGASKYFFTLHSQKFPKPGTEKQEPQPEKALKKGTSDKATYWILPCIFAYKVLGLENFIFIKVL